MEHDGHEPPASAHTHSHGFSLSIETLSASGPALRPDDRPRCGNDFDLRWSGDVVA